MARVIGFDIETSGQGLIPHLGKIEILSLNFEGRLKTVRFDRSRLDRITKWFIEECWYNPDCILVGHNLIFDVGFISAIFPRPTCRFFCTKTASTLLYAGSLLRHSLADVVSRELGVEMDKTEQLSDWSQELTTEQIYYCHQDVVHLLPLYEIFTTKLKQHQGLSYIASIENEYLKPLAEMSRTGFGLDFASFEKLYANANQHFCNLQDEWTELCDGEEISYNNSNRLKEYLIELGHDLDLKGKVSTSVAVLERCNTQHTRKVTELRSAKKAIDYLDKVKFTYDILGRVVGRFNNLNPSGTGRTTCSSFEYSGTEEKLKGRGKNKVLTTVPKTYSFGVNLQQTPKVIPGTSIALDVDDDDVAYENVTDLRSCLVPSRPGRSFVVVDFDGAHARIAAQVIQDPLVIDTYLGKGTESHSVVASMMCRVTRKQLFKRLCCTELGLDWLAVSDEEFYSLHQTHLSTQKIEQITNRIENEYGDPAAFRKLYKSGDAIAGQYRALSKNCFYGKQNGCFPKKYLEVLAELQVGLAECEAIYRGIGALVPGQQAFIDSLGVCQPGTIYPSPDGYGTAKLFTSIDKRICYLQLKAGKFGPPKPNVQKACMFNWMTVESTIKKAAAVKIYREISAKEAQYGNAVCVHDNHDELVFECDTDKAVKLAEFVKLEIDRVAKQWITLIPWSEDVSDYSKLVQSNWAK